MATLNVTVEEQSLQALQAEAGERGVTVEVLVQAIITDHATKPKVRYASDQAVKAALQMSMAKHGDVYRRLAQ